SWPATEPAIAITSQPQVAEWKRETPSRKKEAESRPEGYRLFVEQKTAAVWIIGADLRGTLFGVGRLLREIDWAPGSLSLAAPLDVATAPVYPIRGHQLGYRAQANSYDAWDAKQFEQYIRELTYFGANSIEAIPFQD